MCIRDSVVPGCAATFSADTEEDLLAQVAPHAAEEHDIKDLTPEVVESVKAAIKES